jgi:hypothetical protein
VKLPGDKLIGFGVTRVQDIPGKPLACGSIIGLERIAPVDGESRVLPGQPQLDPLRRDDLAGEQGFQQLVAKTSPTRRISRTRTRT